MCLRPFGLYCSACLGILFVSILCMCCSHFSWYCFISFTIFSAPVFSLIHVLLTKSLFKSAGIRVSHFFSMLPSTLMYFCSVEPVRMHFPAKQLCTNDTVCNAAKQHCTQYSGNILRRIISVNVSKSSFH